MNNIEEIKYDNLRMMAFRYKDAYTLEICVASGHADFFVELNIEEPDLKVIRENKYRRSLLQAALHYPFQLEQTWLSKTEQRHYLDIILYGSKQQVDDFLNKKDGDANGAISNMIRITCKRDPNLLRKVSWFF